MPTFTPGRTLSHLFYHEAIAPILHHHFPNLPHSAALLGPGSEVLGYDTPMSTDHDWGPRCQLFLTPTDHQQTAATLHHTLAHHLPFTFRDYPTHFTPYESETGTQIPTITETRPIHHRVQITTLPTFLHDYIGTPLDGDPTLADWLTIPEQHLLSLTAPAPFHDGLNILAPLQQKLTYYPHDLWLYLLAAQWKRIGEEEPFVGRTGHAGDELGSAVLAARLVRDIMRLCLLMAKQYAPYPKWFGTAFSRLNCAPTLTPLLHQILQSTTWQTRQIPLAATYEILATLHNNLHLTDPIPTQATYFFDRPFLVIWGTGIAEKLWNTITDPTIKSLPFALGKSDQYTDSTDLLTNPTHFRQLTTLYTNTPHLNHPLPQTSGKREAAGADTQDSP